MMLLLCLVVGFGVALFAFWLRRLQHRMSERAWRPRVLKNARLIYAEKLFRTWRPFPLIAKVDRAYLLGETIVLVELKTRKAPTVYRSDIIELSAQRVAIEGSTHRQVSKVGYIIVQNPDTRIHTTHEVTMLSTAQVISLGHRYEGLNAGRVAPTKTDRRGLCAKCPFVGDCRPEMVRRDTTAAAAVS
jgi:hypothetical protein